MFLSFMGCEHGFVPFVGFGGLGSIDFGYKMLNVFDIMLGAPVLSILTNLCCLVNFLSI